VDVQNGFGDLLARIQTLPEAERKEIEAEIDQVLTHFLFAAISCLAFPSLCSLFQFIFVHLIAF
jgi:hypothetical protein